MATEAVHSLEADALPLHRLDVETYDRLVESGALEGLDVELIEGLVLDKPSRCRQDPVHRFDVRTFDRMVATGALEGHPIELLDGLLVEVSPQGPAHAGVIEELTGRLSGCGRLRVQLPLEVGARSLPEPDLALVERPTPHDRHPGSALLAVEVAVTSQHMNRGVKARMYASVGVPTYWLVDVPGRKVEVRTDPGPGGYRRCDTYGPGERVPSPAEGVPDPAVDALFA